MYVHNVTVSFVVDTGVDETIIPESIYNKLNWSVNFVKPDKFLHGTNSSKLEYFGKSDAKVIWSWQCQFYLNYLCCQGLWYSPNGKTSYWSFVGGGMLNCVEVRNHHPLKLFSGLGVMKESMISAYKELCSLCSECLEKGCISAIVQGN